MNQTLDVDAQVKPKKRKWWLWVLLVVVGLPLLLVTCVAIFVDPLSPEDQAAMNAHRTAQDAIRFTLKDPDSAQFRNIFSPKRAGKTEPAVICGEVNSKNSFGAMAGFTRFVIANTGKDGVFAVEQASSTRAQKAEFDGNWSHHCVDR